MDDTMKYSEMPNSSDLIYRQAAIDAADAVWSVTGDKNVAKVWDQIKDLPSAQPEKRTEERTETHACDLIDRQAAIDALHMHLMYRTGTDSNKKRLDEWINNLPSAQPEQHYDEWCDDCKEYDKERHCCPRWNRVIRQALKDAQPEQRWIPCSERLPENNDPVNVTWVNHNPEVYYADIKDKPFTATAHYHNGSWYWFSSVTQDYLNEYDVWTPDLVDKDVEITAWMPLPEPYRAERRTDELGNS